MADPHRPLSEVLHQAIASGDLDTVQALLQKGVNANSPLVARCPIDRHSLISIDRRSSNFDRRSIGMDRRSSNFDRRPSVDKHSLNGRFDYATDYDPRNSIRETPIIESDYEAEKEDLIEKCIDPDDVFDFSEINNRAEEAKNLKNAEFKRQESEVLKSLDDVYKYLDVDEHCQQINETQHNQRPDLGSCGSENADDDLSFDGDDEYDAMQSTMVYCEEMARPISFIVQPKTTISEAMNNNSLAVQESIDERLNDDNATLIERLPSVSMSRQKSEELLIEEKPMKLLPRIKRKLSNRWRSAQHREKTEGKVEIRTRRRSRNVDNEQLEENYDGLAFFEAVRQGMDMTVQTLLETSNNFQLNLPDENGFSPLMQAAWHGQNDCLKILLDHGANISLRNTTGCTATHFAAGQGHVECLDTLINYGNIDVNSQTKFGATPLILAAKGGHIDCVNLLLENGADVNMQYRGNQNALLFAAGNGHYECMQILIDNNVSVDQANSQGVTPLMRAIQQCHNDCAALLISKGSDVNVQDVLGRTPVHVAIESDNPDGLTALIEAGANVEYKTKGESTPLDYADKFQNIRCQEIVLARIRAIKDQVYLHTELQRTRSKPEKKSASCISCFKRHGKRRSKSTV